MGRGLPNGDYEFDRSIPLDQLPVFLGYKQTADPYVWRPDWPACRHRKETQYFTRCGKVQKGHACVELKINVIPHDCQRCTEREE